MRNFALAIFYILLQLATLPVSPPSATLPPLVQIQVQVTSSNLSFLYSPMSSQPTSLPPTPAFASQPCHLFQAGACNSTSTPTDSTELDLCIGQLSKLIHTVLNHADAKEINYKTFASKLKIMENLLSTIEMALDCDKHVEFPEYERCPS